MKFILSFTYQLELSKAEVIKEGKDITIIGYGTVLKTIKEVKF